MGSKSVISNLSWKFAERILAQVVTLIVTIVLARILEPSSYGIISIIVIFIAFANVFVSGGFGNSLIRKKNADAMDFSSALYFNIALSIVLYLLLFFAAPYIAAFYGEGYEQLSLALRVMGLRIIIASVNSIQHAYIAKKMQFKMFFFATLFGTVISAAVGILMAIKGYGVWALVFQYLTNTFIDTVVLAFCIRRLPVFRFSFKKVKDLSSYGLRVLGTSLLIVGFEEMRALLIGKVYSSTDLACYDKAKQFPSLIVTNINSSISSVLFPKMSEIQDEPAKIKQAVSKSIRFSAYIMSPLTLGLAIVAESFVVVLLTEKWIHVVPLLQMFCVYYLFQPIHAANMEAIKVFGKGNAYVILETVKKVIELVVLFSVLWLSVKAIVLSMTIVATSFIVLNSFPNKRFINYPLKEQIKDILPGLLLGVVMMVAVYFVGKLFTLHILRLCIQVVVGMIVYIVLSVLTKNKEFNFILGLIKGKLFKRRCKQ